MLDDKMTKLSWLITFLGRMLWTTWSPTPILGGIPDFYAESQE